MCFGYFYFFQASRMLMEKDEASLNQNFLQSHRDINLKIGELTLRMEKRPSTSSMVMRNPNLPENVN